MYSTRLVRKMTGATANQLKYWVKLGLVRPRREGKSHFYSFRDIVKLRVLVTLRNRGLSLQKVREGIKKLSEVLPREELLSQLMIYTDGIDMIVVEKGRYFNAVTKQYYLSFDTERIEAEIHEFQKAKSFNGNRGRLQRNQKLRAI